MALRRLSFGPILISFAGASIAFIGILRRSLINYNIPLRTVSAFLCLPLLYLSDASPSRTVRGYITGRDGNPARNVRVKAMDSDWPDEDDVMETAMTDYNGYYEIHYEGGHWDPAPHSWTYWRPDIFIRVSAPVNGRCDNGVWNSSARWIHLGDSRVTDDHPHRYDLTKNLQLTNYPLSHVEVHTFERGVDMWSEVDFFFHSSAFECAPNGDKVRWDSWGIGGPPTITTRCWTPPLQKCTDADYKKIRDIGLHPLPIDQVNKSLVYFIKLDEIDEGAEKTLAASIMEVKDNIIKGNKAAAKDAMKTFKQKVDQELEKGAVTKMAAAALLASADRFLNSN